MSAHPNCLNSQKPARQHPPFDTPPKPAEKTYNLIGALEFLARRKTIPLQILHLDYRQRPIILIPYGMTAWSMEAELIAIEHVAGKTTERYEAMIEGCRMQYLIHHRH